MTTAYCPSCDHDVPVEAPPCADGHGELCPDRVCLQCGTALLVEPSVVLWAARRRAA